MSYLVWGRIASILSYLTAAIYPLFPVGCSGEQPGVLDRTKLVRSFTDDFSSFGGSNPGGHVGRWKTSYDFGLQEGDPSSRTLQGELEVYSDTLYNGTNPFKLDKQGLAIIAAANPDPASFKSAGRPYTSGLLTTSRSFQQRYGYYEIRAILPQGPGLWPAFWLAAPLDPAVNRPQHPGEIDVMEMLGRKPDRIYCSAHWPIGQNDAQQGSRTVEISVGRTDVMKTYGVLWTADRLTWYVDDKQILTMPNPGLHRPMMILVNLAIGGDWGGPPNMETRFPTRMLIASINAYRLKQ